MSRDFASREPAARVRVPSYRRHKPTGQAVVTLNGHDVCLGRLFMEVRRVSIAIVDLAVLAQRLPHPILDLPSLAAGIETLPVGNAGLKSGHFRARMLRQHRLAGANQQEGLRVFRRVGPAECQKAGAAFGSGEVHGKLARGHQRTGRR